MAGVPEWVEFRRSDAAAVVALVRAVAEAADPGEHGDGVEVVIEVPRRGWFRRLFDDGQPEQARIGVTKPGGEVRYPFHVQLITDAGGKAAHRVPRAPGWATSNSAGLAFLMRKGRPEDGYDWADLVTGTVNALTRLRPDAKEKRWRAAIDRAVRRV
jgi:hypothetical protein